MLLLQASSPPVLSQKVLSPPTQSPQAYQELKSKLTEVERDKWSAEAVLDSAKRQIEGQRVLLCQAKDQLVASKEKISTLKKKLEEAEKARDKVEQDGYDIRVVETEEALRAEVLGVCRNYCLQV